LRDGPATAREAAVDRAADVSRPPDARVDVRSRDRGQPDLEPCPSPCVTTFAGRCGLKGFEDGPAASAKFWSPSGIALEASGALLIADRDNNVIRRVSSGQVTTVAGTGSPKLVDGPVANAAFISPEGLAVHASGAIVVGDTGSGAVRQISGGQVTTLFNNGMLVCRPTSVLSLPSGVLITDSCHNRLDLLASGALTVLAGTLDPGYVDGPALTAQFSFPHESAVDASGALYISDSDNHAIRKLSGGAVTTVAGVGFPSLQDGPALKAGFKYPRGVAVAPDGAVLIADSDNDRIRRLASGQVSTLAGTVTGYQDGPGIVARFTDPERVAVDSLGTIYVADTGNHCIRVIR
jgi:sugar lactone lactonase YvrE